MLKDDCMSEMTTRRALARYLTNEEAAAYLRLSPRMLENGLATIWDADVLIWAASQVVEARDADIPTSRCIAATPYEILSFIRRGTSARDYQRLKASLDRLQSTSVVTSIRQATLRRL